MAVLMSVSCGFDSQALKLIWLASRTSMGTHSGCDIDIVNVRDII